MVKIRLRRVGAKKQASYRLVAADSRAPRDGRFIEEIGFYNPRTEPETVRINEERVLYWLSVGAQPTDAAARLLKSSGTLERFERLKQGEPLEALVAEAELAAAEAPAAEAEAEEAEEEAPEAVEEAEEAEPEEPAAEAPAAETETEEAEEEAPEAVEEAEEAELEEPAAETEIEEAEEDEPEPETSEEEDNDEPEE